MTDARCVPPDGAEDGSLHLLDIAGRTVAAEWAITGHWFPLGAYSFSADAPYERSRARYLCPIPSPAELARLREIEEAAREVRKTLADVLDYLNDLEEAIQLEIRVDDARDRLTAALAKEPT